MLTEKQIVAMVNEDAETVSNALRKVLKKEISDMLSSRPEEARASCALGIAAEFFKCGAYGMSQAMGMNLKESETFATQLMTLVQLQAVSRGGIPSGEGKFDEAIKPDSGDDTAGQNDHLPKR